MDFSLNEDQLAIQQAISRWAKQELPSGARERDKSGRFAAELFLRCNEEVGVTRLPFSTEYGGLGHGMLESSIAIEEIARYDQSLAVTLMVSMASGLVIQRHGTAEQKAKYLPAIAAGTAIGAVAGTEPHAGSWTAGFRTRAKRNSQGWQLDGEKAYITNCGTPLTSFIVVCAVSDPDAKSERMSMFLVPKETPGIKIGKAYDKLGWRSSDTHPIYLQGVQLGEEALVGKLGQGRHIIHNGYKIGRILISAMAVGMARACLEDALAYANQREAFGQTIGSLQLVQKMLADIAVKVETARLLVMKAAWASDTNHLDESLLSITKYYATEIGSECADLAIQIHGGYGFMDECAATRQWRDGRILRIGDGTSQIQVLQIARALLEQHAKGAS